MSGNDKNNIHKEHRKRVKEKYLKHGADLMETHQLLEMLLFFAIPREDTNPTAHRLLDMEIEGGIASATPEEMRSVEGVGERSAQLVRGSIDTTLRLLCDGLKREPLTSEFQRRALLYLLLRAKGAGHAVAVYTDKRDRVIEAEFVARGRMIRSAHQVTAVTEKAKMLGAAGVAVAHNHKNNNKKPSIEDCMLSVAFDEALCADGISFLGHYIVTDTDCIRVE